METAGDRNAGRGATIQNLHCSEVARWPGDPAETLAGLARGAAVDGELVLESTPNGADGCFYEEWQRRRRARRTGAWCGISFPGGGSRSISRQRSRSRLDRRGARTCGEPRLSGSQIGFRRAHGGRISRTGAAGVCRRRRRMLSGQRRLLSSICRSLDARLQSADPAELRPRNGGELLVWIPPLAGQEYLVAVDPAGGGSEGDYSAAQVIDLATGLQCAELQAKLGTLELAQRAAALGREYRRRAWLVVERNNHGAGVLAYLRECLPLPASHKQEGQEGWLTSSLSRPAMIGRLAAALVEQPELFQSRRLLKECRSFVRLRNGKTGAQSGAHDDCVMAMAIALRRESRVAGQAEVWRAGGEGR